MSIDVLTLLKERWNMLKLDHGQKEGVVKRIKKKAGRIFKFKNVSWDEIKHFFLFRLKKCNSKQMVIG